MYYKRNGKKVRSVEPYNTPLEKFAFKSIEHYGSSKSMNAWTIVFIVAIGVITLLLIAWFIWLAVKKPGSKSGFKMGRRRSSCRRCR